jgi:hypothetical protein
MKNQKTTSFNDFISFRKFISLTFIQVIYVIGALAVTIAGIVFIVLAFDYRLNEEDLLAGIGLIILGNLIWRVICEAWILFFRLASSVGNIEKQVKTLSHNSLSQTENPAIHHKEESAAKDNKSWKCPKCGSTNQGNTFNCESCGYSLV